MRAALCLIAGLLAGAGGTYGFHVIHKAGAVGSVTRGFPTNWPDRASTLLDAPGIDDLAMTSNQDELRRRIADLDARGTTSAEKLELEVLLARLLELDAESAVNLAIDLDLGRRLLTPMVTVLAESDRKAAFKMLKSLKDPAIAEAIGVELLNSLGADKDTVEQLLEAIPGIDPTEFRIALIETMSRERPTGALVRALAFSGPRLRFRALRQAGIVWARTDPVDALAHLDMIDDRRLREAFQSVVFQVWSLRDPIAAVEYAGTLEDLDSDPIQYFLIQSLAQADAAELLSIAYRLPESLRHTAQKVGFQTLVRQDPRAALDYLETVPPGVEHERFKHQVASGYGRMDPDAALLWARSMDPPMPSIEQSVLAGIAQTEPSRALELALGGRTASSERVLQVIAFNAASANTEKVLDFAASVAELPASKVKWSVMSELTSSWAKDHPDAALEWFLNNSAHASAETFARATGQLVQDHPDVAAAYVDRIPEGQRTDWIKAVAFGYAHESPRRAADWIARFHGEPAYDAGAAVVATNLARQHPYAAAELLGTVGTGPRTRDAAIAVAGEWANKDPYSAARWARNISDPKMRASAISGVAQVWVWHDPRSAERWVLNLPNGATRDRALMGAIAVIAKRETPSTRMLDAFSSTKARQRGLRRVIVPLARRDVDSARRLIDRYFTDPALHRKATRLVDQSRGS